MNKNKINEQNVAVDDLNGITSEVTQEIYTDNEADNLGCV